jgi:hypothetical protein
MATKEQIESIVAYAQTQADKIEYNNTIFEIMEGDLLKYVGETLRRQLSPENATIAMERAAPINIWNKIVKKLSKLYANAPKRTTENPADQELIEYYEKKGLNRHFGNLNENFNAYKWSSIEIFEDEEIKSLRFRAVPSNQFLAYSNDPIDPLRITAIIKFMGEYTDASGVKRQRFWIYTNDEFIPVLDNGEVVQEDLFGNDGLNPFGIIPFQYASMSEYVLVPMPDLDTKQMTCLIPVLITDQNFGSLFLSLPIIYAVDAGLENLPVSPNMFVNLKSDSEDGKQAQIGVVKAEPNLEAQMNHVKNQLAMWLESKDIKPGTVGGNLTPENFASGISKIISEMDTIENRKMQEEIFQDVETKFWKRLAVMHNELAKVGRLETRKVFSDPATLEITVDYGEETIVESRADLVVRLKNERDAGFISTKKAIQILNPKMEEGQIEELIVEIDDEKGSIVIEDTDGPTEDND